MLEKFPCIRFCCPAWSFRQFHTERYIGSMAALIHSRWYPHATLTRALSRKCTAELITRYTKTCIAAKWAQATGMLCRRDSTYLHGSVQFPKCDDANVQLLPSTAEATELLGPELLHMKADFAFSVYAYGNSSANHTLPCRLASKQNSRYCLDGPPRHCRRPTVPRLGDPTGLFRSVVFRVTVFFADYLQPG